MCCGNQGKRQDSTETRLPLMFIIHREAAFGLQMLAKAEP